MNPHPEQKLTLRECADKIGVPTRFIREEIVDGRLRAAVAVRRPSGRTYRRVRWEDFVAYCRLYSPSTLQRLGIEPTA